MFVILPTIFEWPLYGQNYRKNKRDRKIKIKIPLLLSFPFSLFVSLAICYFFCWFCAWLLQVVAGARVRMYGVVAECRQRRRRHAARKGLGNPRFFFLILFVFWAWFGLRVLGHILGLLL
ncbi:hypothetical protein ES332_D06G201900v1 [Gossypium tomentosum]|uniref:Transmembrane protein n=1 Tax=Gossypium tomentosum TaxID=34277 RepID=A0A5D2KLD9_GOSTO|nr:hypothetical protein ES332_D06G201900v1 [Gossypium tomentosum]